MINSNEAENIVCGVLLANNEYIDYISPKLEASDFYSADTHAVYLAIRSLNRSLASSQIGPLEVIDQLLSDKAASYRNKQRWSNVIFAMMESVPSTCNIQQYIDAIKICSLRRKAYQALEASKDLLVNKPIALSDVLKHTIDNLEGIEKQNILELPFKTVGEICETVLCNTEEAYKKGEKILGLDTGFNSINEIINGLLKNNLIILAARPAVGKSTLALNIANNVAMKGKHVAYFSLEMSSEQLVQRLIASHSGISLSSIQNGDLTEEDWKIMYNVVAKLKNLPIHIDQTMAYSVNDIKSKCLQLKAQNQLDLIVIDYLQLIEAEHMGNRVDEVGYISRELKKIAQTLEVPVLALSQLSRGIEQRQDKTPQLSDLRESGSIEQDADIVMFLYKNTATSFSVDGLPVSLKVAKNRQGRLGTAELLFNGKYSRFMEK